MYFSTVQKKFYIFCLVLLDFDFFNILMFHSVPIKNKKRSVVFMRKNEYRTYTCGELREKHVGEEIKLAGWVDTIRDLGGVLFIDLRDEFGITQIVIHDEDLQEQAKQLTTESCIHISRKSCGKSK